MDMRVRAELARLVARPGDVGEIVVEEDADVPLGAVADRFAFPGS